MIAWKRKLIYAAFNIAVSNPVIEQIVLEYGPDHLIYEGHIIDRFVTPIGAAI